MSMRKIETLWHHLLHTAVTDRVYKHTQKELAAQFGYSTSTVHHALAVPTELGAIRKAGKFFVLEDALKLLYYWASVRNLAGDLLSQTSLDAPVKEIEGLALPESIYGCYTAATHWLGEPPTDYDKVYFYIRPADARAFRERFPKVSTDYPNVFALRLAEPMRHHGSYTTLPQTFVDIWNLRDWYGRDFTQALEQQIRGLLS